MRGPVHPKLQEIKVDEGVAEEDEKVSDDEELNPQNCIPWQDVHDTVEGKKLILCKLESDLEEHIVASLLYWQRISQTKHVCVQVIRFETVSEEKRCLLLELKNENDVYSVKYFVSHEMTDIFFVEDFELTRKSKAKVSKLKLIGAKIKGK